MLAVCQEGLCAARMIHPADADCFSNGRGVRNGMVEEQLKITFSSLIQYFHMELNHSQL